MNNPHSRTQQEQFQSPDYQTYEMQLKDQNQEQENIFSVRKFLCQPNPLMNKIQFAPYQVNSYYPYPLSRLPLCLQDFSAPQIDKNNMNNIIQAHFQHEKIKKQVGQMLLKNKYGSIDQSQSLQKIQQYYQDKSFVYQRYVPENLKLDNSIKKMQYFATLILDISQILEKQSKRNKTKEKKIANVPRISSHTTRQTRPMINQAIPNIFGSNKNQCRIEFNSNFQSGNLFRAYQVNYNQFDLVIQNDINTKGNNQWFYFSVKNVSKNSVLKFNLVNMTKKSSLFNLGMKPCVFSMAKYQKRNIGWVRQGQKVSYCKSDKIKRQQANIPYYQLSFQYKFIYDGDIVYFAHSPPYTYSHLSSYLLKIFSNKKIQKLIKLKELGLTLGSCVVDLIQITNFEVLKQKKKVIWITARQHPGQVTSGLMLQGIINFLLNGSQQSKYLLNNFIFKIVPMVNIDGVIHGNSRAQLIGVDPNRKWTFPHKYHNPIVYQLRNHIEKDKNSIQMFLDLHSHSKKLGTFFYGNTVSQNSASSRIYPLLVCKSDKRFRYQYCRFSGGNKQTARSALFQSLKIPLIYTVESSFFGYQNSNKTINPYLLKDYQQMGVALMTGLANYSYKKSTRSVFNLKQPSLQDIFKDQLQQEYNNDDVSSVGSDDCPNQDEFSQKQLNKLLSKVNRKNKTTKKLKQLKVKKQIMPQNPQQKIEKVKINTSESYYKQYFSGRISQNKVDRIQEFPQQPQQHIIKNKTFNVAIQVQIKQNMVLMKKQSNNQINLGKQKHKNSDKCVANSLCVIGQKVQEITVYGNTVGIQVSQVKQIFMKRRDHSSLSNRKSFNLKTKPSHLQVKQNNFLQRGDFGINELLSRRYG